MSENKKLLYRQGDVLIQEHNELPQKDKIKRKKGTILVYGETSGHTHSLSDRRTARIFESLSEIEKQVGTLYLEVFAEKAEIIHPEHATIILTSGIYKIWRQREYDLRGAFRMVID